MNQPRLETIHGEPSLPLRSEVMKAWLTPRGGMLAPVDFTLPSGRVVQPYSLSPWQPQEFASSQPVLLQVLRGDFFCFPFSGDETSPAPHGEGSNGVWSISRSDPMAVEMRFASTVPPADLVKRIQLRAGETNVYQEHTITTEGRFNYGHHPILHVPEAITAEVRTSPFRFGSVYQSPAGPPAGERGGLRASARFSRLQSVPLATGGESSLARFPIRPRTEDIIMLAGFAAAHAWTAVTFDRYVWFSLRRAADFPGTLFWMSDGGRDLAPWNGRHTRRIGVEDVCSHYCDGPALSAQDRLASEGVITSRQFKRAEPVRLPHVQGVVEVPEGFGGVALLEPSPSDRQHAILRGEGGTTVEFKLDWSFLD